MPTEATFREFLQRVRGGDPTAAEELVRVYGPAIRREARLRIQDQALRRHFDSEDVCQSVLASFFVRVAAGQYDLEEPRQLLALLLRMARNKVATRTRRVQGQPADARRHADTDGALAALADPNPSPRRLALGRDLVREVFDHLDEDERELARLRGDGLTWPQVAAALGGTAEGRRKQLGRALDRVAAELDL